MVFINVDPNVTYRIIIATSDDVWSSTNKLKADNIIYTSSSTSEYNFALPTSEKLDFNTTYYWQVETIYNGNEVYSNVESFKTYADPADIEVTPTASYPTGGVDIYTLTPNFYWYVDKAATDVDFTVYYKEESEASYTALPKVTDQLYAELSTSLQAGSYL